MFFVLDRAVGRGHGVVAHLADGRGLGLGLGSGLRLGLGLGSIVDAGLRVLGYTFLRYMSGRGRCVCVWCECVCMCVYVCMCIYDLAGGEYVSVWVRDQGYDAC